MLIAENIFLRTLQPKDVDVMLEWENNPKNWSISGTKEPFSKEEINQLVHSNQNLNNDNQIRYLVCLNSTQETIGTVDLFEFDAHKKKVGIGVLIADLANRRKGYAEEAITLAVNYCRNELHLVDVFCNIHKENSASICLFEKCGFQFVEERELFEHHVNYYEIRL